MASRTLPVSPDPQAAGPQIVDAPLFTRNLWFVAVSSVLLLIFALAMYLSVRTESQTFDEPAHLYSGYTYWLRSDFGMNPEHPPLVKLIAALPALLVDHPKYPDAPDIYFRGSSVFGGFLLLSAPGSGALLDHARAAVSIFALLLAAVLALAGAEMFGRGTALFALALLVFDPLILAHGPLVTTDTAATCLIFATVYTFYRYVKRPTLLRLAVCGAAAGLALSSKHSALFVFPILILLAAIEVGMGGESIRDRARLGLRLLGSLAAIGLISFTILWSCYGFRYAARPNGKNIVPSSAEYLKQLKHPAEAAVIGFAERHHLLPESYLFGLNDIVAVCRDGRSMFLYGKPYPSGRWFYFPAALLVKGTIGFLVLLLLVPLARGLRGRQYRREVLFLAVPPVAYLAWAMTSKLDIGIRHILPVYPFLILLGAAGAVQLARRSLRWRVAVTALLVLHAASSLLATPNYLTYSNEFFGGPQNTWHYLADSNVGWDGGLRALSAEIRKRGITECWFAYSGIPSPAAFGIPCKRLPTFFGFLTQAPQPAVPERLEGPVFASTEDVTAYWGPKELNPYREIAALKPNRVIAGEILEYDGGVTAPSVSALSHAYAAMQELDPKAGAAADALNQAKAAVALDPNSQLNYQALAYAYAANRQIDAARQAYQTAVHLFNTVRPDFKEAEFAPQDPLAPPQQQ
jgi:4-amino-4-deoxy-L-arabinose transferase-like glycosyltransferase